MIKGVSPSFTAKPNATSMNDKPQHKKFVVDGDKVIVPDQKTDGQDKTSQQSSLEKTLKDCFDKQWDESNS